MQNKYFELFSSIQPDTRTSLDSILIIDGLNTFLRAFTMINHINPNGHHIGGLTGFLKSVGYAIKMLPALPENMNADEIEISLTFIGFVGMIDPPREEAKRAVAECKQAGIVPVIGAIH